MNVYQPLPLVSARNALELGSVKMQSPFSSTASSFRGVVNISLSVPTREIIKPNETEGTSAVSV